VNFSIRCVGDSLALFFWMIFHVMSVRIYGRECLLSANQPGPPYRSNDGEMLIVYGYTREHLLWFCSSWLGPALLESDPGALCIEKPAGLVSRAA